MGAVGGLAVHDVRRTQAVLERLAQQRVAAVAYKDTRLNKDLESLGFPGKKLLI